jgi:hypothetical protein
MLALVAVPPALLGVLTAGMLLRAAVGTHPFWHAEPLNLSEAAAVRDQATVVQLMRLGEDPFERRDVRADLLFNDLVRLTPLESAIASGRAEIADIILWSSPRPSDEEWNRLRCLVEFRDDDDLREAFDRYKPESVELACSGITQPWK